MHVTRLLIRATDVLMGTTRLLIHVTDALISVTSLFIRPTGLLIGVTGTLIQIFRPKKAFIRYQGRLRRRAPPPNAPIRLGPSSFPLPKS